MPIADSRRTSPRPRHLAAVAGLALALAACTSTDVGDKVDYRTKSAKTAPLDVPPDLTQLSREARYTPQAGSISATTYQGAAAPAAVAAPAPGGPQLVAATQAADMHVERSEDERWLVTSLTPEQVWPRIKAFWLDRGFVIAYENAEAGVMETDWAENRAKIPSDWIRNTIGRVLDSVYSTSERDKFRTRVERTPTGSEIYITHRGMVEVFISQEREQTMWTGRPSDPQLEADQMARLMVALGSNEQVARAAVAEAPQRADRARVLTGQPGAALQVDDTFERAWRRVGVALDRAGFTVEDRDRTGGVYFVRYVDPKDAAKAEPGLFTRMFGATPTPVTPTRYRIAVKGDGETTTVSVLDANGGPESGEVGQRIVAVLVQDLK